jgi:predicted RNA binding protein YcfA (HicA-like mRNA interferase family)
MYFKHENGSYKRVPIYPNAQLGTKTLSGRDSVNRY